MVNAQKQVEQIAYPRVGGARAPRPEEERDAEDIARAKYRAKKKIRQLVKEMGADRFITLTTRQSENSVEELLGRWQRWLKLVERASGGRFHYVAVVEPHPTNPKHFHMHVAVAVFLNVNVLRQCWWRVCGGRGMGNVHIKRHWPATSYRSHIVFAWRQEDSVFLSATDASMTGQRISTRLSIVSVCSKARGLLSICNKSRTPRITQIVVQWTWPRFACTQSFNLLLYGRLRTSRPDRKMAAVNEASTTYQSE